MKFKGYVALLLFSSSAFAYNQQEIAWLIKHHTNKPYQTALAKQTTQNLQWEALQGPLIDGEYSIVVMKNNNAILFAYNPYTHTDIYKSIDAGQHWKTIPSPKNIKLHDLISLDENRLVLAADNQIYTSQDQGEHWNLSTTIDSSCDKLFSPNPGLVLLTTNFSYPPAGLYRSTDGGQTFTPARLGIDSDYPFFGVGGRDNILITGTTGLYLSINNGVLWTQPSSNWKNKLLRSVAINSKNDIFIVTGNLYKTDVTGKTWEKLDANLNNVKLIKTDKNDRLYVTGENDISFSSLYRSSDQGKTWELLHQFKEIIDFDLLDNGKIAVNTNEGLMLSDETQLNYTKIAEIPYSASVTKKAIALDKDHFFATVQAYSDGPLYGSNDAGKTWSIVRPTKISDIADFTQQIAALEFNGNNQEVVASNDQGKTWQVRFQITGNYCHSLSSQHGGLMLSCEKTNYFTKDLFHWNKFSTQSTTPILSSYFSGKTLYITDGNFIKSSTDNGNTWISLLDNLNQYGALISGYNDDVLIIAFGGAGIIKMTNGGKNWDLISDGLPDYGFTSLVVMGLNNYLVSTDSGVYSTEDGGKHWVSENQGLNNVDVLNLYLNQNTLLAGTNGSGVFKAILS